MRHSSKASLVIFAALLLTAIPALADPDPATQTIFQTLMDATVANNYDGFISVCDDTMKSVLTKPMLEGVSHQIAPRVKAGYDAQYLGELSQRGYAVHLWKLHFKDGGDDMLATLSIKDGKAGGFFLH